MHPLVFISILLLAKSFEFVAAELGPDAKEIHSLPSEKHQKNNLPSFTELALRAGTDKVTTHKYQHVYERYFHNRRNEPMNVLEIGLGCMGAERHWGGSLILWRAFFFNIKTKIHFIEYDPKCRDLFAHGANQIYGNIFLGDQSNTTFLELVKSTTGKLDLIVDDGSHNAKHQAASFKSLWPAVNDHGVYVIEDMEGSVDNGIFTLVPELMKTMYHNKTSEIQSVDLHHEAVAITKLNPEIYWSASSPSSG